MADRFDDMSNKELQDERSRLLTAWVSEQKRVRAFRRSQLMEDDEALRRQCRNLEGAISASKDEQLA